MRRGLSDLSVVSFEELKQLVEINSYTWNKEGVDTHGLLFSEWIQEIGYSEVRYPRETIGDHLLFRSSFIEGQKRVLLLGHLDTVFPPGSFEQFDEDDEWVYGPGVCDMKGGNLIALQALRAVYQTAGGILIPVFSSPIWWISSTTPSKRFHVQFMLLEIRLA